MALFKKSKSQFISINIIILNQYYHTPYNKAQPILELGSFAEEHPCGIDTGSKGAAGVEFAHRLVVENFGDAVSA